MYPSLIREQPGERSALEHASQALLFLRAFVTARRAEVIAACLLLLMAANMLTAITRKGLTNDEFVHIPAGYYHLVAANYTLNNEHPPLIKMWAALPLLFIQPQEPSVESSVDSYPTERTSSALSNFWLANSDFFQLISFWTRAVMIPLTALLGWLIFVFARQLAGGRAGVLSVALYSLEPTMLAHGRVVHTDVPAAFAYLIFFFALYRYIKEPNLRRALVLALVTGAALITKFSLCIIAPVFGTAALILVACAPRCGYRRAMILRHVGLIAIIVLFIINAAYRFQSQTLLKSDVAWVRLKTPAQFDLIMAGIAALSKIVPTYFLFGIYNVGIHNLHGHAASLLGAHSDTGWWYYFPVAFALKTTIPFLLLSVAALVWAVWQLLFKRDWRFLFLIIPIAIYTVVSLSSSINIGIRHFLPVYPFLFILGGMLLDSLLRLRRMKLAAQFVVALLLCWITFEAARAYPSYTPYMNQLAWKRPAWQYLSDSNVEWGDDVPALAAYLRARGETKVRAAFAGNWITLVPYGITYVNLFSSPRKPPPETTYVAIGASFLNGSTVPVSFEEGTYMEERDRQNFFASFRDKKPEAVFGNSIYLYRMK
ncbi:MAG: glycosyltransferase family 39 protein [Pyrinomonadaceae bacterium]|nr:glycosyltransferase family 39 protein [Pyrinomonadaceae bacterium]